MAKSKWFLLLTAEVFSAISLVVIIVSFLTDSWVLEFYQFSEIKKKCDLISILIIIVLQKCFFFKVISEIKYTNETVIKLDNSDVSYGLFDGKLNQNIFTISKLIDLASEFMN